MTVRYCRYVRSLPDRAPNPIKGTSSVSWYDVENNPTWQAMRRVGELTRMVIDGKKSMQMICSPPGLGKSEEVLQAAAVAKIKLYHTSPDSIQGLCADLWRHRDRVCLLDDCDTVFQDKKRLNVLKMAHGPQRLVLVPSNLRIQKNQDLRQLGSDRYDPDVPPPTFPLGPKHGLIALANANYADPTFLHPNIRDDFRALVSRGLDPLWIPGDPQSVLDYTIWLVVAHKMLLRHPQQDHGNRRGGFPLVIQQEVLDFLCVNARRLTEISPRMACKLAMARRDDPSYEMAWKQYLAPRVLHPALVLPDETPQLVSRAMRSAAMCSTKPEPEPDPDREPGSPTPKPAGRPPTCQQVLPANDPVRGPCGSAPAASLPVPVSDPRSDADPEPPAAGKGSLLPERVPTAIASVGASKRPLRDDEARAIPPDDREIFVIGQVEASANDGGADPDADHAGGPSFAQDVSSAPMRDAQAAGHEGHPQQDVAAHDRSNSMPLRGGSPKLLTFDPPNSDQSAELRLRARAMDSTPLGPLTAEDAERLANDIAAWEACSDRPIAKILGKREEVPLARAYRWRFSMEAAKISAILEAEPDVAHVHAVRSAKWWGDNGANSLASVVNAARVEVARQHRKAKRKVENDE